MKKLLKIYSLQTEEDYYRLILESFDNGQFSQAYEQLSAMPKKNRVDMLKCITVGGNNDIMPWDIKLGDHKIKQLFDRILV